MCILILKATLQLSFFFFFKEKQQEHAVCPAGWRRKFGLKAEPARAFLSAHTLRRPVEEQVPRAPLPRTPHACKLGPAGAGNGTPPQARPEEEARVHLAEGPQVGPGA